MKHLYIYVAAALTLGANEVTANTPLSTANSQLATPDSTSILSTLHSETLQASKDMHPQTLQECLERGLQKNYSLRIVRNEEQMAANNATMENAGLLPSVSLSAGYSGSVYGNDVIPREGDVTHNRGIYDDGIEWWVIFVEFLWWWRWGILRRWRRRRGIFGTLTTKTLFRRKRVWQKRPV